MSRANNNRPPHLSTLQDQLAVLNHCIKKINSHIQYLQVLHDLVCFSEQMSTTPQTACPEGAIKSIESLSGSMWFCMFVVQGFVNRLRPSKADWRTPRMLPAQCPLPPVMVGNMRDNRSWLRELTSIVTYTSPLLMDLKRLGLQQRCLVVKY